MEYEFLEPSLKESSSFLFGTDGSAESSTNEHLELGELFDCAHIDQLSVDDLRRVCVVRGKLCRRPRTVGNFDMNHV